MAYASRAGRARVSASSPQAFAVCQRCGIWYNRVDLQNQYQWAGAALLPTWIFVCQRCYDEPQQNGKRVLVLPADPVPIQLPFPEDFSVATSIMGLANPLQETVYMGEVDLATYMTTTDGAYMTEAQPQPVPQVDPITNIPVPLTHGAMQTTDGVLMAPTPTGRPPGYYALDRAPVTPTEVVNFMAKTNGTYMAEGDGTYMATEQPGSPASSEAPLPPVLTDANEIPIIYGATLPVVALLADGTPLVQARCNAPHGLALNSQIAVQGAANPAADGIFSVIPITATAFTYGTYSPVDAGSILGPDTRITTVLIGLPRDFPQVPQTGPAYSQRAPTKRSQ